MAPDEIDLIVARANARESDHTVAADEVSARLATHARRERWMTAALFASLVLTVLLAVGMVVQSFVVSAAVDATDDALRCRGGRNARFSVALAELVEVFTTGDTEAVDAQGRTSPEARRAIGNLRDASNGLRAAVRDC